MICDTGFSWRLAPLAMGLFSSTVLAGGSETYQDYFPKPDDEYTGITRDYADGELFHTDWGTGGNEAVPEVNVDLPMFDGRDRALTSVELFAEVSGEAFGTVTNIVMQTLNITVTHSIDVTVDLSALPTVTSETDKLQIRFESETMFEDVPSGEDRSMPPFRDDNQASVRYTAADVLAHFVDPEPTNPFARHDLSFPVIADGQVNFGQNTGNMASNIQTLAGARGTVVYNYLTCDDLDFDPIIDNTGDTRMWLGTLPTEGESCETFGFTAELQCDGGAAFDVDNYQVPAGCKLNAINGGEDYRLRCDSSALLTNDANAESQYFDLPDMSGSAGTCTVDVVDVTCNDFGMGQCAFEPAEFDRAPPPPGPPTPPATPVPVMGGFGLGLLGGLMGLLAVFGARREK